MTSKPLNFKIVLLGDAGVGKTSVMLRFKNKTFVETISTIGVAYCESKIDVNGSQTQLYIWDTAGQERFRTVTPSYYRGANAVVMFYDISKQKTFKALKSWMDEIKVRADSSITLCVVGNKCDLEDQREVPMNDGQDYATSIGALFYETSALNSKGIDETFHALAARLVEQQQLLVKESEESRREKDVCPGNQQQLSVKKSSRSRKSRKAGKC